MVASPNPSSGGDRLNGTAALAPSELWVVGLLQTASGTRTVVLHLYPKVAPLWALKVDLDENR